MESCEPRRRHVHARSLAPRATTGWLALALTLAGACADGPVPDPGPRQLRAIGDAARRALFVAIIACEDDGLRAAAAVDRSDPTSDAARAMRQHEVERTCKEGLAARERLSEQQLDYLRTYGMGQGWFEAHADEAPVVRVPLGPPASDAR